MEPQIHLRATPKRTYKPTTQKYATELVNVCPGLKATPRQTKELESNQEIDATKKKLKRRRPGV